MNFRVGMNRLALVLGLCGFTWGIFAMDGAWHSSGQEKPEYPAFGFLIPWGTVKVAYWIGAGFSKGRTP